MFGAPERVNGEEEVKYHLPVESKPIGVKYEVLNGQIMPNLNHQDTLSLYKNTILAELINHKQLFKNPPTLEYLQAITPNWGCIIKSNKPDWSPYTVIDNKLTNEDKSYYVDLTLVGLFISRSTISPRFETVYIENSESNIIDLDWSANSLVPDVEEVSDISLPSAGTIELRDPAALLKAKMEAKQSVKEAFQKASDAQNVALELAKKFTENFDVSDNESMFSEWIEDSDGDDQS
jgi:hypothetical protein